MMTQTLVGLLTQQSEGQQATESVGRQQLLKAHANCWPHDGHACLNACAAVVPAGDELTGSTISGGGVGPVVGAAVTTAGAA
jgi:hypothetical protein